MRPPLMLRLWPLLAATAVEAVRREAGGARAEPAACPCGALSLESQFARMVAVSYDEKGIRSLESYAKEIFSCYSWSDFYYKLPTNGIVGRVLAKAAWSTPTALVGRCAMRPQMCTVTFSGATNLNFVAGIMDYGPVRLYRNETGGIEEGSPEDVPSHRFHKFYWEVYKVFRSQIGLDVRAALSECTEVYVTGHSIGAAMAAVFQWENLERRISQITMGQNLAWFGTPPDVGCRGRRLFSDQDPVPYLRCFVDKSDGEVVRHAAVPAQKLAYSKSTQTYKAYALYDCEADTPMDAECVHGCSAIGPHYTLRIGLGLSSHQASEYIKAADDAFPLFSG
ncbi:unnamed protein product [Symbiodinium natans]|uniref:Fungal lipase-type domain-containing protein n=1 Tax=Symbiodinium natans TaxID=878477 RepID=A0A812MFH7_9DINO|nr:unnamed protein product [Symbiodinium natans]